MTAPGAKVEKKVGCLECQNKKKEVSLAATRAIYKKKVGQVEAISGEGQKKSRLQDHQKRPN